MAAQEQNQRAVCMICNKAVRVNDRKYGIERYIVSKYFSKGRLDRAEYEHWKAETGNEEHDETDMARQSSIEWSRNILPCIESTI